MLRVGALISPMERANDGAAFQSWPVIQSATNSTTNHSALVTGRGGC